MRAAIFLLFNLMAVASVCFADEKLPVLKVRGETYSNVIITAVSATDIFFTCDKGMANAHLKDLSPALQKHFNYHPFNAVAEGRKTRTTTPLTSGTGSLVQMRATPELERVVDMDKQVRVLCHNCQTNQALTLAIQTWKLSEDTLGPEHPMTTVCLNNLGWIYLNVGRLTDAAPILKRCLEVRERILGPQHPWTAISLYNLANCYFKMGKNSLAEPLYERGLAIDEKVSGPDSKTVARDLAKMGENECGLGDYRKAEKSIKRNLAILEKLDGVESPDTAPALFSLGMLYRLMGDFAKSKSFYERALAIQEKSSAQKSSFTALVLAGLGRLYREMGDYPKAESLIRRAVKIDEMDLGSESPETGDMLGDLVRLYCEEENWIEAHALAERILKIDKKTPGVEPLQTAGALNNLGEINFGLRDYSKAEYYDKQCLAIRERVLGTEHPLVAASLEGISAIYSRRGEFRKAARLLQRALEINEKILGPDNPATVDDLAGLTEAYFDLQRTNAALNYADKREQASLAILENVLSFTSEQQRLKYEAQFDPYIMFASLNDARRMAQTVLRHKGVVLDSLLEDGAVARASRNPEVRALIDQLKPAKQRLTRLLMAAPKDLDSTTLENWAEARDKLSSQVQQLEGALAQKVAGFGRARRALTVTVEQVQHAIPPSGVLLELIRYHRYLGHQRWTDSYGVVILTSAGAPKWVCLGAAKDIDRNVLRCQQAVRDRKDSDESKLSTALHQLYEQIWEPLKPFFPANTRTVIISPDASLNFVSFATLLTPDERFLAEKYSIQYVASGRDLLRKPVRSLNRKMVVFAAPDYDAGGARNGDKTGLYLQPLPYFAKNAVELKTEAKQWNWPVQVYSGDQASETQLRHIHSPRILHFATHGFFLPKTIQGPDHFSFLGLSFRLGASQPRVLLMNPMYRSGIALTGAQVTLDAWQRSKIPPTDSDGILTAEEVGGLDLHGTWLVVLSACDTGIGEPKSGEGVMGLRRGFIEAGAQNLLMTLWPVFDVPSGELMLNFYSILHKDNNPAKALAEVQRDALIKLRSQYGLLPAVVMAGGFVVNSEGPPH